MTDTRSPADPSNFRCSVHGARWYHDPLPGDEVAEATDEKWPSVTTVKKAWSKPFRKTHTDGNTYELDALRVALYVDHEIETLVGMSSDVRVPLMAGAAARDLRRAGERGSSVHALIESIVLGQGMLVDLDPSAALYADTCEALVSELSPIFLYAEAACIARGLGVAGTFDAILSIAGGTFLVDWKSRGADSKHGCYPEEASQLGAYSLAEYMIVAGDDGGAVRRRLPALDGLLIVSIKPDSFELFPVDLNAAQGAAHELLETWSHRRAGEKVARSACGHPVPVKALQVRPAPTRAPGLPVVSAPELATNRPVAERPVERTPAVVAERTAWVKKRINALAGHEAGLRHISTQWPNSVPQRPPWRDTEIDAIARVVTDAEALIRAPFPDSDPGVVPPPRQHAYEAQPAPRLRAPTWPVDDGPAIDAEQLAGIKEHIRATGETNVAHLTRWADEGHRAKRPWDSNGVIYERHYGIGVAAVACVLNLLDGDEPDVLVRAALGAAVGRPLDPGWLTGAVIGSLSTEQALRLTQLAEAFPTDNAVAALIGRHVSDQQNQQPQQPIGDVQR